MPEELQNDSSLVKKDESKDKIEPIQEEVQEQPPYLNKFAWGTYSSDPQRFTGWLQHTEFSTITSDIGNIGVDYNLSLYDNKDKINDSWRRNNRREKDENFYDIDFNKGTERTAYNYAKLFSIAKLNYFSVWGSGLENLRIANYTDRDFAIYSAITNGNYETVMEQISKIYNDPNTDKETKHSLFETNKVLKKCQEFVNTLWSIPTEFDNKYTQGRKQVLPIRLELDEINEGYVNKYAESNLTRYGIKYVAANDMGSILKGNVDMENKYNQWIYQYASTYDLSDSGAGFIFVPEDKKQFVPLILRQLAECRANDYTNQKVVENTIDNVFVNENPHAMPEDEEGHFWYTTAREMGFAWPDFTFDGITNATPGASSGNKQGDAIKAYNAGIAVGTTVGATVGGTVGIPFGPTAGVTGLVGAAGGGAVGGLIVGPIFAGIAGLGANNTSSGEYNGIFKMSRMLDLGDELNKSCTNIERALKFQDTDESYTTEGTTIEAIPRKRLNTLQHAGLINSTVAKDILNNEKSIVEHLKSVAFTSNNYSVYTQDKTGVFTKINKDMVGVFEKALRKQDNIHPNVILTSHGYSDETFGYYEFSIPVKDLLESQYGSKLANAIDKTEDKSVKYVSERLGDSGLSNFLGQHALILDNAGGTIDINDNVTFRVPVNVVDSRDVDQLTNPYIVASAELTQFGNQDARMYLLKDSYFGDLSLVSNHVNDSNGKQVGNFVLEFDGKEWINDSNIKDKYSNEIYNDNAEAEQLVVNCRDYMINDELLRLYKETYGENWVDNTPSKVIDSYARSCAKLINTFKQVRLFNKDDAANITNDEKVNFFFDDDMERMFKRLEKIDEDLPAIVEYYMEKSNVE